MPHFAVTSNRKEDLWSEEGGPTPLKPPCSPVFAVLASINGKAHHGVLRRSEKLYSMRPSIGRPNQKSSTESS